jgi:predicted regulator of Ras-like GTPase activity (Roadblock/LC7/MglB family)
VKKEKVNAAELELALKELVATEGVNASAVVTRDGIMVEFLNKHTPEPVSPLSSVVAMMAITAGKCTRMFKKGEMEELITKADGGVLLTERCGEFIFIVAVEKGFDPESIKPQREKVKDAIVSMV